MLGIRIDQVIIEETLKLPTLISVQQTQSLFNHQKNYENIVSPWNCMLAQYILLVRANRHKILYRRFSAMMTRPPDWPSF